jgi:hypothetical protein
MAGHFVELAVFLVEPEPPAFLLRKVILDRERDDGPDACEGVRLLPKNSERLPSKLK